MSNTKETILDNRFYKAFNDAEAEVTFEDINDERIGTVVYGDNVSLEDIKEVEEAAREVNAYRDELITGLSTALALKAKEAFADDDKVNSLKTSLKFADDDYDISVHRKLIDGEEESENVIRVIQTHEIAPTLDDVRDLIFD